MDEQKPIPEAPTPAPKPFEPKRDYKPYYWTGGIIAVLVMAGGIGYYLYTNKPAQAVTQTPPPPPSDIITPQPGPTDVPPPGPNGNGITFNVPKDISTGKPEPLVSGEIIWHAPQYKPGVVTLLAKDPATASDGMLAYEVGVFAKGKYKDSKFDIVYVSSEGPGPMLTYLVAEQNGKLTLLGKYSNEVYDSSYLDANKLAVDNVYTLSDLVPPAQIISTTNGKKLDLVDRPFYQELVTFFDRTSLKYVFEDPKVGAVFTTPDALTYYPATEGKMPEVNHSFRDAGFYIKLPDGAMATYEYKPEIINNEVPQVTWLNGSQNTEKYTYVDRNGCGSNNFGSVVNIAGSELSASGSTKDGQQVFELKDKNHELLKTLYDQSYFEEGKKPTYEQFNAEHPIFFWKDPFGRMLKFQNEKYVPLAECGKPVIYLYPTKAMNISVNVDPKGGFSYTEPDYGSGWNVLAQPNGQLTNLADSKLYPYLFWEGRGGLYKTPDKGFVTSRDELKTFFDSKLSHLGLNAQETSDFEEFWLPRMQEKPYYFVTFMGNQVMDQLAPLTVTPKPDTVIRILMDYKGLDQPISVQGFDIKTPKRNGFTVVEWGGVKH